MKRLHFVWNPFKNYAGQKRWNLEDLLIIEEQSVRSMRRGEWTQADALWMEEHLFSGGELTTNSTEQAEPVEIKYDPLPRKTAAADQVYSWGGRTGALLNPDDLSARLNTQLRDLIREEETLLFRSTLPGLTGTTLKFGAPVTGLGVAQITDLLIDAARGEEANNTSDDGGPGKLPS